MSTVLGTECLRWERVGSQRSVGARMVCPFCQKLTCIAEAFPNDWVHPHEELKLLKIGTESSGALFSNDARYRYNLWRRWDASLPWWIWLMLNPSTADFRKNDPTIKKVIQFSKRGGAGGCAIMNLCAFRSTNPKALYRLPLELAVGEHNDAMYAGAIADAAAQPGTVVVCAWGALHKSLRERGAAVRELFDFVDADVRALSLTKDGFPSHPLYVPYSAVPERFRR